MTAPAIEDALYDELAGRADLAALVGERIYEEELPDWDPRLTPALVYQKVSDTNEHHQAGAGDAAECRVQLTIYAASRRLCRQVRDVLIAALHESAAGGTWGRGERRTVLSCEVENDFPRPVDPAAGEGQSLPAHIVEARIWYRL